MKKEKSLSPAKAAKKKAKDGIEASLVKTFKSITDGLGHAVIDIEKEAKKLAKKIVKGLKTAKPEAAPKAEVTKKEKIGAKPAVVKVKEVKAPVAKAPAVKAEVAKPAEPVAKKTTAKAETAKPATTVTAKTVKSPAAKAAKK